MIVKSPKIRCVLLGAALALLPGCAGQAIPVAPAPLDVPFSTTDLVVGTGTPVVNGQNLTVNYAGWLYSATQPDNKGTQFATSIGTTPFTFVLGDTRLIQGWNQGVTGMQVGGVRRLILPPDLAYGPNGDGTGVIPGNATIIFEVTLLSVQ